MVREGRALTMCWSGLICREWIATRKESISTTCVDWIRHCSCGLSEKRLSEKRLSEKRLSEKRLSEKRLSEKRLKRKQLVKRRISKRSWRGYEWFVTWRMLFPER